MAWLKPYWQRELEGVPVFGQWALNAGRMIELWAIPCETTPAIVIEGFFHELPVLIWSLTKPDPIDAVWDRFGQRGGKPGRHNRRTRNNKQPPFRYRGGNLIPGSPIGGGKYARYLFPLGALAQRIGWYFLIADATQDFLIKWTTTVMQWEGCIPAPYWLKGVTASANPPGGFVGDNASIAFVATSSIIPNPHIVGSVIIPSWSDFWLQADISLFYGGFLQCEHEVSCYFYRHSDEKKVEIISPQTVTPTGSIHGSKSHFERGRDFSQQWSVRVSNNGSPCTCRTNATSKLEVSHAASNMIIPDPP